MYAILSDIHGNLFALKKVAEDMKLFEVNGVILLGDLIDYGMQSNEVISFLQNEFPYKVIISIWGNHEDAIINGRYERFSSQRGVQSAQYVGSTLTKDSLSYLNKSMIHDGYAEFDLFQKRTLAIHGSLEDHYWKAIAPDNIRGEYAQYDLVLSGHSHYSHYFTRFYEADDVHRRNKHAVIFINPGSVGQPRNHNPHAQYVLIDKEFNIYQRSVPYDVSKAMNLFHEKTDRFYRDRLEFGV